MEAERLSKTEHELVSSLQRTLLVSLTPYLVLPLRHRTRTGSCPGHNPVPPLTQGISTDTHLFKTDVCGVDHVRPVPLEVRVRLVLEDEDDVSRDVVRRGVPFFGERDFGSLLPAPFDDNVQDLILSPHGPAIGVEPSAGDLHPLGGAVVDLFQGHLQLVDDGWVLDLPPRVQGLLVPPVNPVNAVEAKPAEGTERIVVVVDIHVFLVKAIEHPGAAASEEDIEGVGASEERREGGVGVSVEGVVESVP